MQCTAVKRFLDSKGIEYVEESGSDHAAFLFELNKYMSAPITVVKEDGEIVDHFYGNDVDKLNKLLEAA